MTVAELVKAYALEAHPEGGFYRESYRSAGSTPAFGGVRSQSTAIYFLLPAGAKSRLHRIKSDELWHFYLGGPMTVVQIAPAGEVTSVVLGRDFAAGQRLQHAVPAGHWFGAFPNPGTEFSFVGCTVAPGFDFADFELARRADLLAEFPSARAAIELLTHA